MIRLGNWKLLKSNKNMTRLDKKYLKGTKT